MSGVVLIIKVWLVWGRGGVVAWVFGAVLGVEVEIFSYRVGWVVRFCACFCISLGGVSKFVRWGGMAVQFLCVFLHFAG